MTADAKRVALLPGDYVGPEVTDVARVVLEALAPHAGMAFTFTERPFGGAAIDAHGEPFPAVTRDALADVDAVLLGAVGGPQDHPWNALPRERRVESGLLALRAHLGVFANLRPVVVHPGLEALSPLKPEVARGTDVLIVRELTGGIYFGSPSHADATRGVSTMVYERPEVERIARVAFEAARGRGATVTSVDKANVLDVSQFWRDVVTGVREAEFPDVALEHTYVDAAAMKLASEPTAFDVILTGNLFGDVLSDLAAVLPGSLGLLPSASLGGDVGLFEPVHGSAPDIAGRDLVNPVGMLASAAMMLRHALDAPAAADALDAAVRRALADDPTRDLGGTRGTTAFRDAVVDALDVPTSPPTPT